MSDRPHAPKGLRFPSTLRVKKKRLFERLLERGVRGADGRLTLWVLPNGLPFCRLGLIVGRKHGGAVRRNRIKRILREAFRHSRPALPGGFDLACAPRVGADIQLHLCVQSLANLVPQLARRATRRQLSSADDPKEP